MNRNTCYGSDTACVCLSSICASVTACYLECEIFYNLIFRVFLYLNIALYKFILERYIGSIAVCYSNCLCRLFYITENISLINLISADRDILEFCITVCIGFDIVSLAVSLNSEWDILNDFIF